MTYEIKQKYTRGIQREFNKIMFGNSEMINGQVKLDPSRIDEANDYLVMTLFGISKDELDEMDPIEFEKLTQETGKLQNPKK